MYLIQILIELQIVDNLPIRENHHQFLFNSDDRSVVHEGTFTHRFNFSAINVKALRIG